MSAPAVDSTTSVEGHVQAVQGEVLAIDIRRVSRFRMILCGIFAVAYATGAFCMGYQYQNVPATIGYVCTTLVIGLYMLLISHRPESVRQCTFLSLTRRGVWCFSLLTLAFVGVSLTLLYRYVSLHEALNGNSSFMGFIAFLMAAKWSACCAVRIRFFRQLALATIQRMYPQQVVVVVPGVPISPSAATVAEKERLL